MPIETERSLNAIIDELISFIIDTIDGGKKDGQLIPQKTKYRKWVLHDGFKYTDRGVEYTSAGVKEFTRNDWEIVKFPLCEFFEKSEKYRTLSSKINLSLKEDPEELLDSFVSKLISILLEDEPPEKIQNLRQLFLKEINNEPIRNGLSVAIAGLVLRSPKLPITNTISLRQTRREDLETETDSFGHYTDLLRNHLIPSAYLEIEDYSITEDISDADLQRREWLSIAIFRLFKVASVISIQSKSFSDRLVEGGNSSSYSTDSSSIPHVKIIKESEERLLQHFWESIESYIPESFTEPGFSDLRYSDIAYRRYTDALLTFGPEEFRITNAMMGLESIFLRDGGELQELSYRLRLRVAKLVSNFGYEPFEVSKAVIDAYEVRSKFVHGGLLKFKSKEKISEKYGSLNNLIEKILDFLRLAIIVSITMTVSKDELVSVIDKSFLDSQFQDKLNQLVNPAKNIVGIRK